METAPGQSASPEIKSPHLQALLALVDSITEAARVFLQGLSAEQLTWKPDAQTWSIAECFDH
ncbi:MAG: DinB family protein, partial [Calditrichaeota bacterium]|nr:DinB family protein [Calditrichota bacterium]MCB0306201.1 DinB family protein [Calditrichota bacterium]